MYGGSDFYFVMENKTLNDICKAKFKLNLTNMHDTDNPTATEWTITMEPGCHIVKKLSTTDSSKKSGVKYSYAFRVEQMVSDQSELIKKIKEKGKMKQITYNDKNYEIYFYSCFYQKKFYFFFENKESDKSFEGNFKYTKKNLAIEGDEGADSITIQLKGGETAL